MGLFAGARAGHLGANLRKLGMCRLYVATGAADGMANWPQLHAMSAVRAEAPDTMDACDQ